MSNSTRRQKQQAPTSPKQAPGGQTLISGSDVEIAERIADIAIANLDPLISAEGFFWQWRATQWQPIPAAQMRRRVHLFNNCQAGGGHIRLSKSRINSILHELAVICTAPDWFASAPAGINCASGFIRFDAAGNPTLESHRPDHRQRHTLPGHWKPDVTPPTGTLLARLLSGCFLGDADAEAKVALLGEICGCVALGHATKLRAPKCIVMYGPSAENGKSQVGNMVRAMLPESACCAISPSELSDDRKLIVLVGQLLNERNEISGAKAIGSEVFKTSITGEAMMARNVYESAVTFRPVALHLFATNKPPRFDDGIDRGVRRRLLPLVFNRTIPNEERTEDLGERIGAEESDALLAFAISGASRLLARGAFTEPASSAEALNGWIAGDVIAEWASAAVHAVNDNAAVVTTATAYAHFTDWAEAEGYAKRFIPSRGRFPARLTSAEPNILYRRRNGQSCFVGLVLGTRPTPHSPLLAAIPGGSGSSPVQSGSSPVQ